MNTGNMKMFSDILIVEDEPDLATNIRILLRGNGLNPRISSSLVEALKEIRSAKPDILILDIMLPDGNGLDILRHCRLDPELSSLPVIVLSGLGQKKDIEVGFTIGANAYIPKPYDPEKLLAAIQLIRTELRTTDKP